MQKTFLCHICGAEAPLGQRVLFDGQALCARCLEIHTTIYQECGDRIWRDDNAGSRDHPLCQDCYDEDYTTCIRCGALLRSSSACYEAEDEEEYRPYCDSCYDTLTKDGIQDYGYKPEPIFYGEGPRYYGVELEIDGGGERSENARELMALANRSAPLAYCKHDGSLDEGFEMVTHPMTLEYHIGKMPWQAVLGRAAELGYRSHMAQTCGLHVHVNRDAFGETMEEQDAAIARVLYFFEKHWEELLKFSRRTETQLKRWAARYGYKDQPMEILDHAKRGYGGGRYSSVNLQNRDTVEFRMFRGTLKYNTLIATLQLVARILRCGSLPVRRGTEGLVVDYLRLRRSGGGADPILEGAQALRQRAGGDGGGAVMCCLFGMLDCDNQFSGRQKSRILSVLAAECEARGTDATGVAYNSGGGLRIYKRPLPAHRMRFHIPNEARVIMGHTRMATQGSEKRNCNNHPFRGHAGGTAFALAHNGVLHNDKSLRHSLHLPGTNIETDSYVAVQLIEQKQALSFDSLKFMAEKVEGSFAFTVLDGHNNLYFVKGDNPICLYHFPKYNIYFYASTEEILTRALNKLRFLLGEPARVGLDCGDLLRLDARGGRTWGRFDDAHLWRGWFQYSPGRYPSACSPEWEYIHNLKFVASTFGCAPEAIDTLLRDGFTTDELEEMLYCGEL